LLAVKGLRGPNMSMNSGENVETIVSPMASLARKQPPLSGSG
jgi:hypothetical protein